MSCPTAERLWLYLEDRLEPRERERTEEHLSRCGDCRRQLVRIHASHRDEAVTLRAPESLKRKARKIPRGRPGRRVLEWRPRESPRRWQAALAAVLVLALGFLVYRAVDVARLPEEVSGADRLRTAPQSPAGLVGLAPEDGAVVGGGPIEFRWSEVDRVERYTLTVLDARGDVVFRAETRDVSRSVDPSELDPSLEGRTYFWYVTAQLTDGTSRESEIERWTLRSD